MGWTSGGCRIMDAVIEAAMESDASGSDRAQMYRRIIPVLREQDWDGASECMGQDPEYDRVMREMFPDWFEGG